jgi:hypothetical protein
MGDYVSLKKPAVIMRTSRGTQETVLDFKVHDNQRAPAGHYEGVITLTIVPPV